MTTCVTALSHASRGQKMRSHLLSSYRFLGRNHFLFPFLFILEDLRKDWTRPDACVWTRNHFLHASNPIYMNSCCKRQLVNTDTHLNWKQFSTTKHKRTHGSTKLALLCSTLHFCTRDNEW